MKRKLLALLLVLTALLCLTISVSAGEDGEGKEPESGFEVKGVTYDTLAEAVNNCNADTITVLGDDEDLDKVTLSASGKSYTINLNGHTLSFAGDAFEITGGDNHLTITDSSEAKTGSILANNGTLVEAGQSALVNISFVTVQAKTILDTCNSTVEIKGANLTASETAIKANGGSIDIYRQSTVHAKTLVDCSEESNCKVIWEDGSTGEAETGFIINGGKLEINEGTITATDTAIKMESGALDIDQSHVSAPTALDLGADVATPEMKFVPSNISRSYIKGDWKLAEGFDRSKFGILNSYLCINPEGFDFDGQHWLNNVDAATSAEYPYIVSYLNVEILSGKGMLGIDKLRYEPEDTVKITALADEGYSLVKIYAYTFERDEETEELVKDAELIISDNLTFTGADDEDSHCVLYAVFAKDLNGVSYKTDTVAAEDNSYKPCYIDDETALAIAYKEYKENKNITILYKTSASEDVYNALNYDGNTRTWNKQQKQFSDADIAEFAANGASLAIIGESGEKNFPVWAIVLIVVGGLALVYVAGFFFLYKKGILKGPFFDKIYTWFGKLVEKIAAKLAKKSV